MSAAATDSYTKVFGFGSYSTVLQKLLQHVASHGFIAIAPQLYTVAGPDATDEIKSTAAITNCRGGKVAFALALQKAMTTLKFSALIGVDPVDGMDKGKQTPPPVLTYVPHSFDLDMAVMVIGSGLGEETACHFIAKDYGLSICWTMRLKDYEDVCRIVCAIRKAREPMRRFVGGVLVAFLKAYLNGDNIDLIAINMGMKPHRSNLKQSNFLFKHTFLIKKGGGFGMGRFSISLLSIKANHDIGGLSFAKFCTHSRPT
ncbi:DNA-directed RNA polymerase III subunit RPC9 [Hibiscus syriacus]|uniref:DNA-directed RNA polymerase III subunit RPC9 n=1 Tax=Hibiscus syriacus TaxID=106335 RepID=A0A6A2Z3F5_HIBSY|nr:DNA-directed RNA polymerase III subunit RPC9 [Hibiscus syriacus]